MTNRITDERLRGLQEYCGLPPDDAWYEEVTSAINELIERRQAAAWRPIEAPAVPAGWLRVSDAPFALSCPLFLSGQSEPKGYPAPYAPVYLAAAPTAPAVGAPPKMTDEQIERHWQWACDWGVLNMHLGARFARMIESARDEQWRAAIGEHS